MVEMGDAVVGVERGRVEHKRKVRPDQHTPCEGLWALDFGAYASGFRGVVSKAHRLLHHSTLGPRVVKKKKKKFRVEREEPV